jgi:membrane protease YdiL (CAAX protease family)
MILKDWKIGKKYLAITITVILLIIPIFFGIYIDFLVASEIALEVLLFLLIGFAFLLGLGKLMEFLMYSEKSKELMKRHDVIKALLNGNDVRVLLVFFPLTMVMEELIFRYYLIGLFLYELNVGILLAVIISSMIFSLYHLHIWFRFKDLKILINYLITSFLLGIYNAYILITLGIFACIIVHIILVFILYYSLYKKLS